MKKPITVSYEQAKGQHRYATASFSFKRIAKALRVRARNHERASRIVHTGLAQEFDHEAATLRAMR